MFVNPFAHNPEEILFPLIDTLEYYCASFIKSYFFSSEKRWQTRRKASVHSYIAKQTHRFKSMVGYRSFMIVATVSWPSPQQRLL